MINDLPVVTALLCRPAKEMSCRTKLIARSVMVEGMISIDLTLPSQDPKRSSSIAPLRRIVKGCAYRAVKRAQPMYTDADIPSAQAPPDSKRARGTKPTAQFPIASTGFVGRRLVHSEDELQDFSLEDLLKQGFRRVEWDGR